MEQIATHCRIQTSQRRHILYNVWVVDTAVLERVDQWEHWLHDAAVHAGATILAEKFHQFEPHGVTGFLLLAESHISVHTWPEEGLAAIDVFTCGPMDAAEVIAYLRRQLDVCDEQINTIER